jgi:glycerol-3-phosphate dehydrogenase
MTNPRAETVYTETYDLVIIGGGINGAGIARDAAGRGLKVLLCEQHDLAQHTSSASSKLIHGGLRYLEHYEFRLVRKALQEREVLLRAAPHIIWPLRFVMPHVKHLRPKWLIRAGLFFYDHLARRNILPASVGIDFARHPAGAPLKPFIKKGFEYSDGWVYDARLVVLNAMDARAHGATIMTRTKVTKAVRGEDLWQLTYESFENHLTIERTVRARVVVNAAGPWATQLLQTTLNTGSTHRLRQVKGSHIVVKKIFDHPYAYIFQHSDKRIIFAIPYEDDFTLIGTTDVDYHGDIGQVEIDDAEVRYLVNVMDAYFSHPLPRDHIVATYAGVRPLLEDNHGNPAAVTRDYLLDLDTHAAPVLSVFGGKITTFRRLAEDALNKIAQVLPMSEKCWTADKPLPGGDMPNADFSMFLAKQMARYAWLPELLVKHYARLYGTRMDVLLDGLNAVDELGQELSPRLYALEVDYLMKHEWARSAQDVLWRRTKLGLYTNDISTARLALYMEQMMGRTHG